MDVSETSNRIKIMIKMPNPIQDPPASSKASNQDLKDRVVLCTLKSRQRAGIQKIVASKTKDYIQIKIQKQNPSQKPPWSSKAQNRTKRTAQI